jgi:hypothetical protein
VCGAVGEETAFDAGIGPIETVDADRRFARGEAECQGDKEPTLESADFQKLAADAELFRLKSDQVSANGGCKAGRHAAHLLITLRKVAIDGRIAARNVNSQCHFRPLKGVAITTLGKYQLLRSQQALDTLRP